MALLEVWRRRRPPWQVTMRTNNQSPSVKRMRSTQFKKAVRTVVGLAFRFSNWPHGIHSHGCNVHHELISSTFLGIVAKNQSSMAVMLLVSVPGYR